MSHDNQDALRLWPRLDGTLEPVVVHASEPKKLALGRDGASGQLVAAILDNAGGVDLIRFDDGGGELGRAQIRPEPEIVDIVFVGADLITRSADEVIARFDATGAPRGRLVPEPGTRVVSLATRAGALLAGFPAAAGDHAASIRWIDNMTWGATVKLPTRLTSIAIAPDRRHLAGVAEDHAITIVELAAQPRVVARFPQEPVVRPGPKHHASLPEPTMPPSNVGFSTASRLVTSRPEVRVFDLTAAGWTETAAPRLATDAANAAIVDRVIGDRDAGLAITSTTTRFLGYTVLGSEDLRGGGTVVYGTDEIVVLDDKLRTKHATSLLPLGSPRPLFMRAIGSHVLVSQQGPDGERVRIVDVSTPAVVETASLGPFQHVAREAYDPGTGVLAFRDGTNVHRFALDLPNKTAKPLRSLVSKTAYEFTELYLTDPRQANGVVAVAPDEKTYGVLQVFNVTDEAGPPVAPRSVNVGREGSLIGIDRAGRAYVNMGDHIDVMRDGKTERTLPVSAAFLAKPSPDGNTVALLVGHAPLLLVVDALDGRERWQAPATSFRDVAWSPDGSRVVVALLGGLLSFDAVTGARNAAACGWNFGLYDEPRLASAPNVDSACADGR